MRNARRLLLLAVTAITLAPLYGCCGVGSTPAENRRTFCRVADYDSRMLVDDLALFAQTNRTLRTSHWIID